MDALRDDLTCTAKCSLHPTPILSCKTALCEADLACRAAKVDGSIVESAAAVIRASYGPLTAAECVLLGSDVAALTCGIEHELLIQPAQWEDGMHRTPSRSLNAAMHRLKGSP